MSKLFAFEDMAATEVDLAVSPEEGEAADVQTEIESEMTDIHEAADAVDEGLGASDQLEQVESVVADSAEGEGLSPVAAEAIRIAVSAICARVGANPKTVYNMVATENFESASGRKANTRIALEGVSDFIKTMWKKIKAALERVWAKARSFWDTHLSSLGRIKKALMSMKDRLNDTSGKLKDKAYIETAPAGLVDAFGFEKDISVATIKDVIKTHRGLTDTAAKLDAEIQTLNAMAQAALTSNTKDIQDIIQFAYHDHNYGVEAAPMVGGTYVNFKITPDKAEGTIEFEVERGKAQRESKLGVSLSDKAGVQEIIKETIYVIDDMIRQRDKTKKTEEATSKFFLAVEKRINELANGSNDKDVKDMRNVMKAVYKTNAKGPQLVAELLGYNIKLGKAVLGYASLCMSHYK